VREGVRELQGQEGGRGGDLGGGGGREAVTESRRRHPLLSVRFSAARAKEEEVCHAVEEHKEEGRVDNVTRCWYLTN
jgi:hypothetical protein